METKDLLIMVATIIGTIMIPLLGFMLLMRGFIRDTAIAAVGDISTQLATLKVEISAYRESQKELIEVYKLIAKPGNPHVDKEILLEKLKNDTITRDEAIALQEILLAERDAAEQEKNFLKAVIIIGILALVASAIKKQQEEQYGIIR